MAHWIIVSFVVLHVASQALSFTFEARGAKVVPLEQQSLLDTQPAGSSYYGPHLGRVDGHLTKLVSGGLGTHPSKVMSTVRSTESSLEKRMLEKELRKLPFSKQELGEGVVLRTTRTLADTVVQIGVKMRTKLLQHATMGNPEQDYDRYKTAANDFDPRVEKVRKELRLLKAKEATLREKILSHRKEHNELYEKSRFMVPEERVKEMKDRQQKVEQSIDHWRTKAETPSTMRIQKRENVIAAIHANMSDVRQQQQEAFDAKLREQEKELDKYRQAVKKKYYLESNQFKEWSEKVAQTREEIRDLRTRVGDVKKGKKELETNFKQQERQELKDVKDEDKSKLAKEMRNEAKLRDEAKLEQKLAVRAAAKMEQDEKVMAKALKTNEELEQTEKKQHAVLAAAERDAANKAAGQASNLLQVKLKQEIDEQKERSNAEIVSGIRERVKEETELTGQELEAAVAHEMKRHKDRVKELKKDLQLDQQKITELKKHEQIDILRAEQQISMQTDGNRTQTLGKYRDALDGREMFLHQKVKEDEKIKVMKAKLEDEKVQESAMLSKEEAEAAKFKQQAKQLGSDLQKRAGARATASQLSVELGEVERKKKALLSILNGEEEAEALLGETASNTSRPITTNGTSSTGKLAVVAALSDQREKNEKEEEQQQHKLERVQYEAKMSKQKARELRLELKKLHLDHQLLLQHAKNGQKIHDFGGTQTRRAKLFAAKAKAELREQQVAGKELEMYRARLKLLQAQVRRLQDRGDRLEKTKADEAANAKEILGKIETRWSDRLIKNEAKHAEDVKRLKNAMETQQATSDKDEQSLYKQLDQEREAEAAAINAANNNKVSEKYAIDLVGKQKEKLKSSVEYMVKTQKTRQYYNKRFFESYQHKLLELKRRLTHYRNSKEYSSLRYKINQLRQQLTMQLTAMPSDLDATIPKTQTQDHAQSTGDKMEPWTHVKSLGTLLASALDQVKRRAKVEKMSAEDQQQEVNKVVTNIVNVVMSKDRHEADELVRQTLANPGKPSYHYSKMFNPHGTKSIKIKTKQQPNIQQELEPNVFVLPTT